MSSTKSNQIKLDAVKKAVQELMKDENFTTSAIIVAVIALLVTFVLFKLWSRKSGSGQGVLLVGLSDAGKTLIFSQLISGRFVNTFTSMKQNESSVLVAKKSLSLLDLPGYDRLRQKFFDDFKSRAKGIVFVIDSLQFMTNLRDVAEFLYAILADDVVRGRRIPVLVACNKQDEPKAKSAKVIQNQLEKEINAIRDTKSGALGSTGGGDADGTIVLGRADKDFLFGDLKSPIDFADCSAIGANNDRGEINDSAEEEEEEGEATDTDGGDVSGADLDAIRKWLAKVA